MNENVGDPLNVNVALLLHQIGLHDPIVIDWVLHSRCAEAQEWRDYIREFKIWQQEQAIERQRELRKVAVAEEEQKKKGEVRRIAVVDPVINDDWTKRYGLGCWNDPDWVKDTRKKAPEVFVDNEK